MGHGMRHGVLGRVMREFPEEVQRKIAEDAPRGKLPLFHFCYKAAFCSHCQELVAEPVLRFIESGQLYVGKCPKCGNDAENLEEDGPVRCPECGSFLDMQDTGHWD